MDEFFMNGYHWRICFVDPNSEQLIDRTGKLTVATTDPTTFRICLSNALYGDFLFRVILHELGHCALFSYGLLNDVHRVVPRSHWIEAEEWLCNLIADYGTVIFQIAYKLYGTGAWPVVVNEIDRFVRTA